MLKAGGKEINIPLRTVKKCSISKLLGGGGKILPADFRKVLPGDCNAANLYLRHIGVAICTYEYIGFQSLDLSIITATSTQMNPLYRVLTMQ